MNNFSTNTPYIRNRIPWKRSSFIADLILVVILLIITALYILLVVKDSVPTIGLVILGVFWLIYWILIGRLSFSTPLDQAIICLVALVPLSLYISIDRPLSLLKVYGLVLGIAIFYFIVNAIRNINILKLSILTLIFLALAISSLGLLGADWSGSSFSLPTRILHRLSSSFSIFQRFASGGGIHVNTVGGTLSFFVPLLIGLMWDGGGFEFTIFKKLNLNKTARFIYKLLIIFALIIVVFILILTQSRGSSLGSAAGIFALAIWKDRRFLWAIPIALVGFIVALQVVAGGNLSEFIALLDTEHNTLQTRFDYWERTVYLMQDFPYTGTGIGTYGKVFQELYVFTPFSSGGLPSFYAHNMYLAVAANMGIPALILYFSLISVFFGMAFHLSGTTTPLVGVLVKGLSCGMLAHLLYGIWDNYMLGEKLGAVLWIFFGLMTALFLYKEKIEQRPSLSSYANLTKTYPKPDWHLIKRFFAILLFGIINWLLFSFTAITFINISPYASLGIALLGGILLGIMVLRRYLANTQKAFYSPNGFEKVQNPHP